MRATINIVIAKFILTQYTTLTINGNIAIQQKFKNNKSMLVEADILL